MRRRLKTVPQGARHSNIMRLAIRSNDQWASPLVYVTAFENVYHERAEIGIVACDRAGLIRARMVAEFCRAEQNKMTSC